ncbi:MAG: tetratricopeptide repeat protein [Nitrospinae bacterium]|nr:tetratricopeptide repeat protein [Nitrospinota bacterium]
MVVTFFLLFLSIAVNPSPVMAQVHPGYEKFNLSAKDEAEIFFARGRYEEAVEKLKSVLKSEEETSYIFRTMLKSWKALNRLDSAEIFFQDYQAAHKESSHIRYALGYLNYLKTHYQKAEFDFERSVQMDPENGLAWNNWGAILSEKKQYDLAVEKVQRAIKANSSEPIFIWNLQKIYQEMGEPDRFKNEYKSLLQNDSKQLAWAYGKTLVRVIRQKAFGSYSKGELDNAILGFEDMLKIYQEIGDIKGQVPAFFSLGLLHEEKGNAQKAKEYFARVLAINPNHIQARDKIKPLD